MATNLGYFESPNGHHSDRSYQIKCKKRIPRSCLMAHSKVGRQHVFLGLYTIKKKNSGIIGGYWSGLGGIGIDKKTLNGHKKR